MISGTKDHVFEHLSGPVILATCFTDSFELFFESSNMMTRSLSKVSHPYMSAEVLLELSLLIGTDATTPFIQAESGREKRVKWKFRWKDWLGRNDDEFIHSFIQFSLLLEER